MAGHSLFRSLIDMRGNVRACVYTEPLWGIPHNLYQPYVSIYMLALGLTDSQIGLIISIAAGFQIVSGLMGGAITDKLGRKRTTLIFDLISWSIPCLIWAVAQNFWYFLVAAAINSLWRVTHTSWSCLLVEDADPKILIDVYSWIYISGYLAAFFAPIAGILVDQFTLVPTMRALYLLAFMMMTTKFFVMNAYVDETQQGKVRLQETRHQGIFSLLRGYRSVLLAILKTPQTMTTLGMMVIMSITVMISTTFWSILVTQEINVPEQYLSLFSTVRSVILMIYFFVAIPRLRALAFKFPMWAGIIGLIIGQLILISMTGLSYPLLVIYVVIDACSVVTVSIFLDKMLVLTVDPQERARIMALLYVLMICIASPFGWIAGTLSEINRHLPFVLNIGLYSLGFLFIFLAARFTQDTTPHGAAPTAEGQTPA